MNEEKCPCCHNHCDINNLSCGRGIAHFNKSNEEEPKTLNEQVIMDLRKCGHLLHHNKDLNIEKLTSVLSNDELIILHNLLSKIYTNIK